MTVEAPVRRKVHIPASFPGSVQIDLSQENLKEVIDASPIASFIMNGTRVPEVLYHGSAYKQKELKPGYKHSGKIVNWDKYESNIYLYATSEMKAAELLGISSTWEKKYKLIGTHIDAPTNTIKLVFEGIPPSKEELLAVTAYLYTIKYVPGVWIRNNNRFNKIDNEYKTQKTVTDIISCDEIDVREILKDFTIDITGA